MAELITLNQNIEFRHAYNRGRSKADPALITYAVKNRAGVCRYGITVSKKTGCAVERNRCRRIIRAAYASLAGECNGAWDIVFVARFRTKSLKSTDIEPVMRRQLEELGVIG
ncbi:MAG: ribonuclease P protein component [Clostridia bacterium]|nr:ribonuclease P protein component [Clostridia bacterium]